MAYKKTKISRVVRGSIERTTVGVEHGDGAADALGGTVHVAGNFFVTPLSEAPTLITVAREDADLSDIEENCDVIFDETIALEGVSEGVTRTVAQDGTPGQHEYVMLHGRYSDDAFETDKIVRVMIHDAGSLYDSAEEAA